MIFIITGATSFIGLELTRYLLEQGHTVIAVCRPSSNGLVFIPEGVEIVSSEMCNYGELDSKISEADVFINLAWGGTGHNGRNVADIQNENISHTIDAMYVAKKMGCKLFLESGSQAEYGSTTEPQREDSVCNPFSEYGKAKLRVKDNLFVLSEELGIKYIHLRIFSVFGEQDHPWTLILSVLDKMLRNEPVDLSPCTQNWNFIYVKDAVRMIAILCEKAVIDSMFQHEIYNIASDDTRQLREFVERMKVLSNSSSKLNYGAIMPKILVSLQPDITKVIQTTGIDAFYGFDNVIKRIINSQLEYDKGI